MTRKKDIVVVTPLTIAEQLRIVEEKAEVLEEKRQELRSALLESLKRQGVKSVRLDSGDMYVRASRARLVVTNQSAAMAWGRENPEARMKLDSSAAIEAVKRDLVTFGSLAYTEYLTIRPRLSSLSETNPDGDGG